MDEVAEPLRKPDSTASDIDGRVFVRDGVTVLSYGALGVYAFWLYAFGPALALLRAELHFSYAILGLYSAIWAAGAAVVGVSFTRACRAVGRRSVLWWSALGAIGGAAVLITTHSLALTLAGAAVLGFAGTPIGGGRSLGGCRGHQRAFTAGTPG